MNQSIVTNFLNILLLILTKQTFGCRSNTDCSDTEECLNQVCRNTCIDKDCGPHADCFANEHMSFCSCRCGYTPGIYGCKPKDTQQGLDTQQGSASTGPCKGSCDVSAECRMYNNNPYCFCKPEQAFDGQRCVSKSSRSPSNVKGQSCQGETDCPRDRICLNNVCVNPCSNITCQKGLICVTRNHQARCLVIRSSPENKDILRKQFDDVKISPKWVSALNFCWMQDMTLPTVENEYDTNNLRRYNWELKNKGVKFVRVWLGGRDFSRTKRGYTWAETGSTLVYQNWFTRDCPDHQSGFCMHTYLQDNKTEEEVVQWCQFLCDNTRLSENFFCQYYEVDL